MLDGELTAKQTGKGEKGDPQKASEMLSRSYSCVYVGRQMSEGQRSRQSSSLVNLVAFLQNHPDQKPWWVESDSIVILEGSPQRPEQGLQNQGQSGLSGGVKQND